MFASLKGCTFPLPGNFRETASPNSPPPHSPPAPPTSPLVPLPRSSPLPLRHMIPSSTPAPTLAFLLSTSSLPDAVLLSTKLFPPSGLALPPPSANRRSRKNPFDNLNLIWKVAGSPQGELWTHFSRSLKSEGGGALGCCYGREEEGGDRGKEEGQMKGKGKWRRTEIEKGH